MNRQAYPSDLSDTEWQLLEPLLPAPKPGGRPVKYPRREVVNAIMYVLRSGCAWRMLPHDLPPWRTAFHYFRTWRKGRNLGEGPSSPAREGTKSRWTTDFSQRGYHRQPEREDDGKRGPRGYDAGKKVTGRKRHIIVDTMGLLLAVVVHPADIQDRDGAKLVINKLLGRFPRLRLIWADAGYAGQLVDWVMSVSGWALEIVRRPRDSHQFEVLPRRWVVERTFAWLGRCRRLSKDYEELPETTEAWIYSAMTRLMLKRLARAPTF